MKFTSSHLAGQTLNVALYMEHLRDGGGIRGDEIVQAQVGIHDETQAPMARGADVTGSSAKEHSKVHIGELQWGSNPTSPTPADEVAPHVTLEADFFEGANHTAVNTKAFENGVEDNYALYGLEVDVVPDEVLSAADVRNPLQCATGIVAGGSLASISGAIAGSSVCVEAHNGFSTVEIAVIGVNHANVPSDEYLFVAHRPEDDLFLDSDNTGINLFALPTQAIFTEPMARNNTFTTAEVNRSPYKSNLAMEAGATQMHEIGHALNIGRADDDPQIGTIFRNFEVYSGSVEDYTPEEINASSQIDRWSVMALTTDELANQPMAGKYFAFSIEELSTIENP